MFRLPTLKSLARREAVLVGVFAIAGAAFTLGVSLGIEWMGVAGAVVAFLVALIEGIARVLRARMEGKREAAEIGRRTRTAIAPISTVDPAMVGVDPAAPSALTSRKVPEYLSREADGDLRSAVRAALDGSGHDRIVVVVGSSKVGKSRALFEALGECVKDSNLDFIAPRDAATIEAFLVPGEMPSGEGDGRILWLDDLEPFVNEGVTLQTLREWQNSAPGRCVIAATYGGKGSDRVGESGTEPLTTVAGEILRHAHRVSLKATNAREIAPLRSRLPDEVMQSIERHGLAAYLVAASEIEVKLDSRRHSFGEPESPEGMAVVLAAVDWARCGRTDPLPVEVLRDELWPDYLQSGQSTSDRFAKGVKWAVRPVAGSVALLEEVGGGYRAFDYVVELIDSDPEPRDLHDSVWASALKGANDAQAIEVGVSAHQRGRGRIAVSAFRIASRGPREANAATAGLNLGISLSKLDLSEEALAAYDEVVERFGDSEEPAVVKAVAGALVSKGAELGKEKRFDEALRLYEEVVTRYGSTTEASLEDPLAKALFNKALALRESSPSLPRRLEEAVTAYDEVIERFGGSEDEGVRKTVAKALANKGTVLIDLERPEEAITVFDEVVERFGNAEDLELLEQVGIGLVNKGAALEKREHLNEAIVIFDQVVERFSGVDSSALRGLAAAALVNKGIALGHLDFPRKAISAYDRVLEHFEEEEEEEESPLREALARALVNKGIELGNLDCPDEATPLYDQVVERFGDVEEPELYEQIAKALINKGVRYCDLRLFEEALPFFEDVVERFGDSVDRALRVAVATALINKGAALDQLKGRRREAVAIYEEVRARFADAEEPEIRSAVALAARGLGLGAG